MSQFAEQTAFHRYEERNPAVLVREGVNCEAGERNAEASNFAAGDFDARDLKAPSFESLHCENLRAIPAPNQPGSRELATVTRVGTRDKSLGDCPNVRKLLMITSIAGAANCAASLGTQLNLIVEVVATQRESLAALRGGDYAAVIVDDAISESDPQGAELLRKGAGAAALLEVNFAISGVGRLARQVRAELERRERESALAMRLACAAIASELKGTVAGLLLQSQLALAETNASSQLSTKLRQVVQLVGDLRQRLDLPMQCA